MSNIIAQLYRGQLEPKSILGNGNVEMRRTELLIENNYKRLKEKINEDEREILEKYKYCVDEYLVLITEQAFCDGFCVGARILAEAIGGAEKIL